MKKHAIRAAALAAALILCMTLCGCWDLRELDTLSFVLGAGLDAADEEGMVHFVAQISNIKALGSSQTGGSSGGPIPPFLVSEVTSSGIAEALQMISFKNSRTPYLHHNQVLVLGNEQAKKGILPFMDTFIRDHEMRMEVWVVVADDKARDLLTEEIHPEKASAMVISRLVERLKQFSDHLAVSFMNFLSKLIEPSASCIAPIMSVVTENEEKQLNFEGMAVFKADKLIGRISPEQIEGLVWLMGQINTCTVTLRPEGGYCGVEICEPKISITPGFKEGKPSITLDIRGEMKMFEIQGFKGKTLVDIVPLIEENAAQTIETQVRSTFKAMQELGADPYALGRVFHRRMPKKWHEMKDKWEEIYPELILDINCDLSLIDAGKVRSSVEMEGLYKEPGSTHAPEEKSND